MHAAHVRPFSTCFFIIFYFNFIEFHVDSCRVSGSVSHFGKIDSLPLLDDKSSEESKELLLKYSDLFRDAERFYTVQKTRARHYVGSKIIVEFLKDNNCNKQGQPASQAFDDAVDRVSKRLKKIMADLDAAYENAELKVKWVKADYDMAMARVAELEARVPNAQVMVDMKKQAMVKGIMEGAGHFAFQGTFALCYAKAAMKAIHGRDAYKARFKGPNPERLSWYRMPEEVTVWVPPGFGNL